MDSLYVVVYGEEGEEYGQDLLHAKVKCFSSAIDAFYFVHCDWVKNCAPGVPNRLWMCPKRPDYYASFWAYSTPECSSKRLWVISECNVHPLSEA